MSKKKPRIKFAECDKVEELEEWVELALDIIGVDAYITNYSILWDLAPQGVGKYYYADIMSERFGFKIYPNTYIVDIARELKKIW